MTEELFREDSYARSCEAKILAVHENGIELDRTVFYYESGGQPGDLGSLSVKSTGIINIVDTQKDKLNDRILHVPDSRVSTLDVGDFVSADINWKRRYRLMRMHSALHALCAVVPAHVTGAKVDVEKSRIDFNPDGVLVEKISIQSAVDMLIAEDRPIVTKWITDEDLIRQPELVRSMSVSPPIGTGRIRLVGIDGVDLQPCGGTHVASTKEIGKLAIGKVENKGKHNRRVNVRLEG